MFGHREMTMDDYLAILRRRFWMILIPTLVLPIVSYGVSLLLPPKYTSTTTVLVEKPKVPTDIVRTIINDDLSERLGTMQQRILSRSRLEPLVQRFSLYKDESGSVPMEDIVARMRKDVKVAPVRSIAAKQGEVPGFTIEYTSDNPRLAQQVCQEITSMFIEENLKIRAGIVQGATEFLTEQLEDAKKKLEDLDKAMAVLKSRYVGALPGTENANMNILLSLNSQLEAGNAAISRAQQDKVYTQSQLDQAIAEWRASQVGSNPQTLQQQLAALQTQLVTMQGRYKEEHPDVVKLKADIVQLQKKIDENEKEQKTNPAPVVATQMAEPPNIKQLRNAIYQYEQLIKDTARKQELIQESIKLYRARVDMAPAVEQQYKDLTRDYQNAQMNYNELLKKRDMAERSKEVESRQQAEQFKVMDPPNLPERPSFPDRLLFAAGGLGGGLALGVGIAMMLEMRDKSIRNERDVEALLQLPTLALVPSLAPGAQSSSGLFSRFRKAPQHS